MGSSKANGRFQGRRHSWRTTLPKPDSLCHGRQLCIIDRMRSRRACLPGGARLRSWPLSRRRGLFAGRDEGPVGIGTPSSTATRAAATAPRRSLRFPAGVTTKIAVPAHSTEEEYFQACHAATVGCKAIRATHRLCPSGTSRPCKRPASSAWAPGTSPGPRCHLRVSPGCRRGRGGRRQPMRLRPTWGRRNSDHDC